jgi:membrane protease subunit HflC
MRTFLLVTLIVLAVVLVRMSFFTVDPTEYVYVTQFGRHVATYDGAARDTDAGLHWRWPWPIQSVQRLDRRLQHFDPPGTELLTHDAKGKTIDKTLTVEAYVCWRIADKDAVDRFIRSVGTAERAQDILGKKVTSLLGATIGHEKMNLDDLITTARVGERSKVDATMAALQEKLMDGLKDQAQEKYGIELVDVRLRRFNHPPGVRQSIFERIISERNKKVEEYRSEGTKQAANIRSEAEEKARNLLAQARFEEEKLKGEADTEAAMIRTQAHSKDPEFYVFLKKLDKLQSILGDNKTTLLLSSHRDVFDMLFQPPRPGAAVGQATPAANGAAPTPATAGGETPKQATKAGGQ